MIIMILMVITLMMRLVTGIRTQNPAITTIFDTRFMEFIEHMFDLGRKSWKVADYFDLVFPRYKAIQFLNVFFSVQAINAKQKSHERRTKCGPLKISSWIQLKSVQGIREMWLKLKIETKSMAFVKSCYNYAIWMHLMFLYSNIEENTDK